MKLLKVIVVLFLFYFIRRFIQMYKTMLQIQKNQGQTASQNMNSEKKEDVIAADFKVMD